MGRIANDLSLVFSYNEKKCRNIIINRNKYYKKASIPKKNGGMREIYIPSPIIKSFQYYLIEKYLKHFDIHESANAYVKGKSIVDNIAVHVENKSFLKIDITNFFESLSQEKLKELLIKYNPYSLDEESINEILFLTTYKKKFVQGAVSSPLISNILFFEIDNLIIKTFSDIANFKYSRYSDDIVISSCEKISSEVLNTIEKILDENGFKINRKKTYFTSNINGIRITGLNLINYEKITVGTKYKKELKSMIFHKIKFGKKSKQTSEQIMGKLMYLKHVEPHYFNYLNDKYSDENESLVEKILKYSDISKNRYII